MGLYDKKVDPFTDLREYEVLSRQKRRRGPNHIDPAYTSKVTQVVDHIANERSRLLSQKKRIGPTWRINIQKMLKGEGPTTTEFTAEQLCDLFDYAIHDQFWRAYVNDPAGLLKHGHKLWLQDRYAKWSVKNGRPAENRPAPVDGDTFSSFNGGLVADNQPDYDDWGGFEL